MSAFEKHDIAHLSASQINTWINAPSLWVLEKLLKHQSVYGCAAHRGTAVEAGVSAGLFDHDVALEDCTAVALQIYDRLTALNGDPNRDKERGCIPGMVAQGLTLRERGVPIRPNGDQHRVEIALEGVSVPVIGFLDFLYPDQVVDTKTTMRVPSTMSETHLRQASIYKTAHMDRRVRFAYLSDKRSETHTLTREQYEFGMRQLTQAAQRLERFLALSDDPHELAAVVPHNPDTFYFNAQATKTRAIEFYGY